MKHELVARAEAIVAKKASAGNDGYCAVTAIDENGYPSSSTISISKADGIRWLTFATELDSNRVKRMKKCDRVCVCINSAEYHISLVGTVEIITDRQAKLDAWYDGLEAFYSGVDDSNFCVLHFTTERYNLYFTSGETGSGVLSKEGKQ